MFEQTHTSTLKLCPVVNTALLRESRTAATAILANSIPRPPLCCKFRNVALVFPPNANERECVEEPVFECKPLCEGDDGSLRNLGLLHFKDGHMPAQVNATYCVTDDMAQHCIANWQREDPRHVACFSVNPQCQKDANGKIVTGQCEWPDYPVWQMPKKEEDR